MMLQTERIEQLEKQLEDTQQQLKTRNIRLSEMGSVAEAAVHLSGMLEAAQQAADLYLENAKQEGQRILEAAKVEAEQIKEDAKCAAQEMIRVAQTEKQKKKYGRKHGK